MERAKRFYRTEIKYVVLSERPVDTDDLASLLLECSAGDMVGRELDRSSQELSANFMREELTEAGSEPGFFGLDLKTTDTSRISWLEDLSRGDRVQWNDPDQGLCSGRATVTCINSDSGYIENAETIIDLLKDDGSEVEATCIELDRIHDDHEKMLMDLWRRDQVTINGRICMIIDPIITAGDPRTWVWSVAPVDDKGEINGPAFEANGSEIS